MMVANKISYQYPPNFSQRAYLFFSITYTFQYSIQVNSIRIKREEKRGRKGRRKGEGRTGEERRGEGRKMAVRMEGEDSREQIRVDRTWRLFGTRRNGSEESLVVSEISSKSNRIDALLPLTNAIDLVKCGGADKILNSFWPSMKTRNSGKMGLEL